MESRRNVGIIGIGLMGLGIATNIQKNGWDISFLDHPGNQPPDHLLNNGAKAYSTCSALAESSDIIIICVTGTPQVEDVLYRGDGVLRGLKPGSVVIDCSTAIPSSTLKAADAVSHAGGHFLDAPMTRTPKEAAEGRLNLIVGGDPVLFEEHLPLFHAYAENIAYAGPVGSGHKMKLLHNFVSLGFSAVLAEAAACAERGGIEPKILVDVLAKGGGAGVILDRLTPYLLSKDSSVFQFSLSNAHKDMGYYTAMADDLGASREAAEAVHNVFSQAVAEGHGAMPVPELVTLLSELD
ncbi:MAG: NAD(P)-dependent oxidoreductase [Gammaproteobacteria bacterium]|nr:NAD(P)-dependent oxidoreductase [Gammaproteobacteria bacterium]